MPFLSRVAELTKDYRAAKAGVAILSGAGALAPVSGSAQQVAAASNAGAALEQHCGDIKLVFGVAGFRAPYKGQAESWVAKGCKGAVPLPAVSDSYNVQRFNTSARVLQNGANVMLTP